MSNGLLTYVVPVRKNIVMQSSYSKLFSYSCIVWTNTFLFVSADKMKMFTKNSLIAVIASSKPTDTSASGWFSALKYALLPSGPCCQPHFVLLYCSMTSGFLFGPVTDESWCKLDNTKTALPCLGTYEAMVSWSWYPNKDECSSILQLAFIISGTWGLLVRSVPTCVILPETNSSASSMDEKKLSPTTSPTLPPRPC